LLHSSAFGPLLAKAKGSSSNQQVKLLAAFAKACKIDFFEAIDWVSLGIVDINKNVFDVMLSGAWERDKLERCLGTKTVEERDGNLSRMGDLWIGWLDERTLFYTTRDHASKKWIKARLAGKDSFAASKRYASMLKGVDRSRTLWFIGGPDHVIEERVVKGIPEPRYVFGDVAIAKDLKGGITLRYRSRKDATRAGKALEKELAKLRGDAAGQMLLGTARIATKGQNVRLSGYMDPMITSFLATYVAEAIQQKFGAEK
jgi:hypothetical protein